MISDKPRFRAPAAAFSTAALGLALILASCSSGAATTPATPSATQAAAASAAPTAAATDTASHAPTPKTSVVPAPPAGSVRIAYYDNAEVEITASSGRHIFIDVYAAGLVSRPTAQDILLTTHGHTDHVDEDFLAKFPGKKITYTEGTIDLPDVKITGIEAEHNDGLPETDHIFVIDVDGLRIVHFGDLGQTTLRADQMAVIGDHVDIAFSQTYNELSSMDETNNKGIGQMKQVKPLVFVPTHASFETLQAAAKTWPSVYLKGSVVMSRDKLPATTTMLLMGGNALQGEDIGASPSDW